MPQINDIRELAQQNARYVSNSPQDWMSYLDVAARLYRYSFTDTLLIHAQRPDATACAELELWNQKMSRWVNRGAKGIALLDDTGPRTKLRYVFDIADTHLVRGGRTPLLWNLDSHEHEQIILDHLADTYGLSQTDSMNTALLELAQQLTADNLDEAMDGLAYEVAGTFLEELDEDNIRVRFRELMTNSIFYTLSRRCGQEPMDVLDDDDFIRIVDFNKLPVLSFLGNAVSEQCEAVLFDIGREMRKIYKKEITHQLEKSVDSLYNTNTDFSTLKREIKENTTKGGQENGVDVLPQGRLYVPESGREGRAADYREVRDAAQDVPEREPQELVSEYADERQTEPASGADRGSSGEPDGNPAGQPEREVSGTEQGEGPAGMGGTPEQPDGDGRRDRFEGIGVQLTEPTTEQDLSEAEEEIASAFSFPDLPTVEQQIRAIEAPIQARYADEIALDSEVVDEILRTGSNRSKGQLRLIYNFMVEKTPEEYTEFVKNEYGTGGKGFEIGGAKYAVWLRYKNYDDRFSHSNKEWAEQVGTPENNARIIKFRADWVVTSHSAVLDGFVTMYREKLEKQKELKQPFVKRFYVVENRQAVPLEIKRFGNLNDAMSQYQVLPNHYMKALGVEKNPDPLPGSLDILQCRNGLDTIVEDYKMVPGWNNPYIQNHIVQPLQGALAVQDVELAYELPDAYFHIQTCDDGFDYTLYNKDFTERDGGILETDGDKPVQEAMTELLAEFGCDVAQGRVMDAAELREQADMVAEQQAEILKEKLAAERPAPEETLSFYVAECLEFTFAGEFHDHLTMEEALEAYDKIPSERMNADKCIGFCIEEDGGFVGMYELVVNDKVQRENINSINYFRDDKLVQQAISDMEKLMAARQQNKEQERSSTKKSVLDGCVNNVPKKPRRIGGRWSVLDRLHIKQAQRKQKDQTQQQQQERSRKN